MNYTQAYKKVRWSCLPKPLKGNPRQSFGRLPSLQEKLTFATAHPAREPTIIRG